VEGVGVHRLLLASICEFQIYALTYGLCTSEAERHGRSGRENVATTVNMVQYQYYLTYLIHYTYSPLHDCSSPSSIISSYATTHHSCRRDDNGQTPCPPRMLVPLLPVQHDRDPLHKSTRFKSNSHICYCVSLAQPGPDSEVFPLGRRLLHPVSRVIIALLPSTQPTCALRSLLLHASHFTFVSPNIHRIHHRHVSTRYSIANIMFPSLPSSHISVTSAISALPPRPGLNYVGHPLVSPTSISKRRHKACSHLPSLVAPPIHPKDRKQASPQYPPVSWFCLFQCRR
jgi:hypothetical protein